MPKTYGKKTLSMQILWHPNNNHVGCMYVWSNNKKVYPNKLYAINNIKKDRERERVYPKNVCVNKYNDDRSNDERSNDERTNERTNERTIRVVDPNPKKVCYRKREREREMDAYLDVSFPTFLLLAYSS